MLIKSIRNYLSFSCQIACLLSPFSASAEFRLLQDFRAHGSLSGKVTAFHEWNSPDRILVLDSNGHLLRYSLDTSRVIESVTVRLEAGCEFSELRSMKWASPFFVGEASVCVYRPESRRITPAPVPAFQSGTYGSTFLRETATTLQFLINGRPWPKGGEGSGFVSILELNKGTRQSTIRPLYIGVPGFSGGMAIEGDSLFVTAWIYQTSSSRVYSLNLATVQSRVEKQETARFLDEASPLPLDLKGNTGLLQVNPIELLYDNSQQEGAGESFRVNRGSGAISTAQIPQGCKIIGHRAAEWLLFCENSELRMGAF